jgi:hypothetical protein
MFTFVPAPSPRSSALAEYYQQTFGPASGIVDPDHLR